MKFHTSAASGQKTASLITKRNFKNQILDFGMRILDLRYSVHFKTTERHAAQAPALRERFHHSSIDIRHSSFQPSFKRALPLAKKTASLIKEKKLSPQIVDS